MKDVRYFKQKVRCAKVAQKCQNGQLFNIHNRYDEKQNLPIFIFLGNFW